MRTLLPVSLFRMKKYFALVLLSALACSSPSKENKKEEAPLVTKKDTSALDSIPADLGSFTARVRDGKISKEEAIRIIKTVMPLVKNYYFTAGGKDDSGEDWVFPLRGYNAKTIGGKDGSGYIDDGYSFFDGNKHKGHPALDILINDANQDNLDDVTKKPVDVLSVSAGIVIATVNNWESTSDQRGGNYIWIYDPARFSLFYYAHNSDVLVKPGTIVRAGDVIAHVGRTGLNAYKKRSPTHLHFMQLVFDVESVPRPVNPFRALSQARSLGK